MPRPRTDIEPRIVHAARARFLEEGVDGASLRKIARDAHTSIGMIYYYFPTKDDLFLAVVEEVYEKLMQDLELALVPAGSVEERVLRMSTRISQLSDTELMVVKLVVREALISSTRLTRLVERFRRGHLALVLELVSQGLLSGELDRTRHPLVLMISVFALGAAPHLIRRIAGDLPPFESAPQGAELAEQLVGVLFHGLSAQPREEPSS